MVARRSGFRAGFDVALCARTAGPARNLHCLTGRRHDAAAARTPRTGTRIGAADLLVKDEGLNPTGSFKARGLSCAVSMCVELGIGKLAIPSAGNAASALAAYAAAAGLEAHIFMPQDVPQANFIECKAYGAHVTLVDGLISDCARMVAERGPRRRLVRHLDAQRALPHRRQEDHGLRTGRAAGLGAARCHLLSDRRRRGHDRDVEGVRRNGGAGLDSARRGARK